MKRNSIFGICAIVSLTITGGATLVAVLSNNSFLVRSLDEYHMIFDSSCSVVSKDSGYYHQAEIKNNKIDIIGYSASSGNFVSIKQATYGEGDNAVTYPGMIYNRSIINGFTGLTVNYSGATLLYSFSEYLMEDMTYDTSHTIISGTKIVPPADSYYFIIWNNSTSLANISSIQLDYECDASGDSSMIFNKSFVLQGARSFGQNRVKEDSFLEFDNNPTKYQNNYSAYNAKHGDHKNYDEWYRWNGVRMDDSRLLGTHFELHTTIIGNISQMIDPDNYFHFAPWPEFEMEGATKETGGYVMTYIGNDNYEPLGHDSPDRIKTNSYGDESWAGRFYTIYGYDESLGDWAFFDPDTHYVLNNPLIAYRQAFEMYKLPFWHVVFVVDGDDCDVYINNFHIQSTYIFGTDNDGQPLYHGENLYVRYFQFHAVNFSHAAETDGTPYHACYTYPRVKALP